MQALEGDTLRIGPFIGLPKVLAGLGLTLEPLLDELGLPRDLLSSAANVAPVEKATRLLALCAQRSGCPHIGLLLGGTTTAASLGVPGLLAQSSATVGSAIRGLILTLHFNGRSGVPVLFVRRDVASFSFTLAASAEAGRPQALDLSLAVGINLMRAMLGPDWAPDGIQLAYSAPADRSPYVNFFKADVTFDAPSSSIVFPASTLARGARSSDPAILREIEASLAGESESRADFLLLCGRAIVTLIVQERVSVDGVARLMRMHRRTLNRRLAMYGTSVRTLVSDARLGVAKQLLADTRLSMTDIAATLGYSDSSTFTRTFRRWTRMSPSDWRQSRVATAIMRSG